MTWFFYSLTDGIFVGRSFSGPEAMLAVNTPMGCAAMSDVTDWMAQRLDLTQTPPALVDYQPPAPAVTEDAVAEWDATTKRWRLRRTLTANKKARKAPIQAQIDALEVTQHEPARNLLLKMAAGQAYAAPLAKLQAIDDAITPLKAKLAAITACTTQAELDAIP